MPVTITLNHLAVETRVNTDSAVPPPEPYNTLLQRYLNVAKGIVELYAPDAPDDMLNEAVVQISGYLLDAPTHSRQPQNAFTHSGARAILSPWRVISSAKVEEGASA